MVYSIYGIDYVWLVADNIWCLVYSIDSIWLMVYSLWYLVYGIDNIWLMVYSLWYIVLSMRRQGSSQPWFLDSHSFGAIELRSCPHSSTVGY